MTDDLELSEEDPAGAEAQALIAALDTDILTRYPEQEKTHGINANTLLVGGGVFLVARLGGKPVGCGAMRPLEPGVGEVKRMYVRPEARGHGISRAILTRLEDWSRGRGYHTMRLETANRQPEAIGLYESTGYHRIPKYGEYKNEPRSLCFEKPIAARP